MPYGDRLRKLFKAYAAGDDRGFRDVAHAIVEEERTKNHRLLAEDLERVLLNGRAKSSGNGTYPPANVPRDRERGLPLVDVEHHEYDWSRLVVPPKTEASLRRIAEEHRRSDILAASGLEPTSRVLFYGPPGCGKTISAKVLASVLHRPLVIARFDAIVSSYLGETAANLRKVFEFVAAGDGVLLVDELDALAKDRDNHFEHGELKRVVNTILQLIDGQTATNLIIGATNHENLLDSAIWRRFEAVVAFPRPSLQDRILLLRQFLGGFETSKLRLSTMAGEFDGATGSDLEQLAKEAARSAVLDGRHEIVAQDLRDAKASLKVRLAAARPARNHGTAPSKPRR